MGNSKNTAGVDDTERELHDVERELYDVEDELQDFEERQVNVTRTLQMIVYPAMVAFIILSAYGFYLVQSLTTDVHQLTQTISDMNQTVNTNMTLMTSTVSSMNNQMTDLVDSTSLMTHSVVGMNSSTQDMAGNIQQMNDSTQNMAVSTYNMQRDMWSMNKNISGPMKMFNKFSPFGSDKTAPYVVPPPAMTVSPYYNNSYYAWPQGQTATVAPAPVQPPVTAQTGALPSVAAPVTAPQEGVPAEAGPGSAPETPAGAATAKDGHTSIDDDPLRQPRVLASATRG